LSDGRAAPPAPAPPGSRAVIAVLLLHSALFCGLYPAGLSISDEAQYARQAAAFAEGRTTVAAIRADDGAQVQLRPSDYAAGTAGWYALFVLAIGWLLGWKAAFLGALAATVIAVLATARMLRDQRADPRLALLLLANPATLVLGRTTMSDLPATMMVAVGLMLLFKPGRTRAEAFVAGLVGGLSLSLRATNVAVLAPFAIGAVARRERGWPALILGAAAGIGARLAAHAWLYGDPLYTKPHAHGFALAHVVDNLPLHAAGLLLLMPAGAAAALTYRGPRRAELIAATLLFIATPLSWGYRGAESGGVAGWVLGWRLELPLAPVLCVALGERLPVWWRWVRERAGGPGLGRFGARGASVAVALLAVVLVGAHGKVWQVQRTQARIPAIAARHAPPEACVVAHRQLLRKYLHELGGWRCTIRLRDAGPRLVQGATARGPVFGVHIRRGDSAAHRRRQRRVAARLQRMGGGAQPHVSAALGGGRTLLVWRLGGP